MITDEQRIQWRRESFEGVEDAKAVLEMMIQWANSFEKDESLHLKYEDFFKYENLTRIEADLRFQGGRYLIMVAGDGGEGGPSELIAYFERDEEAGQWALNDITHRFDMSADVIWSVVTGWRKLG